MKNYLLSFLCADTEALEIESVDTPDAEVTGQRFTRDVLDHAPVNDYVSACLCRPVFYQLRATQRVTVEPLQSGLTLPRLFLHINRSLIDVKTDFVHQRA